MDHITKVTHKDILLDGESHKDIDLLEFIRPVFLDEEAAEVFLSNYKLYLDLKLSNEFEYFLSSGKTMPSSNHGKARQFIEVDFKELVNPTLLDIKSIEETISFSMEVEKGSNYLDIRITFFEEKS